MGQDFEEARLQWVENEFRGLISLGKTLQQPATNNTNDFFSLKSEHQIDPH